jgi:hypothetical protein
VPGCGGPDESATNIDSGAMASGLMTERKLLLLILACYVALIAMVCFFFRSQRENKTVRQRYAMVQHIL